MTHDIHTIDTGLMRPAFDAAYLIVENGHGAFLDCGTSHAVPAMLAAVTDAGLTPGDIDWLILSHVHLDHAGGAGALLQHLPNARVVVHPRGATHMIDPSRLIAGATAVAKSYFRTRAEQSIRRHELRARQVLSAHETQRLEIIARALGARVDKGGPRP